MGGGKKHHQEAFFFISVYQHAWLHQKVSINFIIIRENDDGAEKERENTRIK